MPWRYLGALVGVLLLTKQYCALADGLIKSILQGFDHIFLIWHKRDVCACEGATVGTLRVRLWYLLASREKTKATKFIGGFC